MVSSGHVDSATPTAPAHQATPVRGRRRRRPASLAPRPATVVRFHGSRAAEGPLTIGQYNILQWLRGEPEHFFAAVAGELDIPPATAVGDVVRALTVLIERHEGLRTTYVDGVEPRQFVHADGELVVEVYAIEPADAPLVDRAALARELTRRLRARGAYRFGELPVRAAVAVLPGRDDAGSAEVVAAVLGCSHLAVDYQAMEILKREFAGLVRGHAARPAAGPPVQPLDLVAWERTPQALRHEQSVLRYWREQFSRMPQCPYPVRRGSDDTGSMAVEMTSAAAAMALRAVTARTRTSRASVVLAALCAVLGHRIGTRDLVVPTLSANRFETHLRQHVGSLAQLTSLSIRVGDTTFDRLVRRAWAAVVDAGRYGRYDVDRQRAVADRVEQDRGIVFDCEPLFNNVVIESDRAAGRGLVPAPAQIHAARSATRLRRQPMPAGTALIRFDLYATGGELRLGCWSNDTGRISADEMESLLLAIECLIVSAAAGDLDERQVRGAIPLDEVRRDAGWQLVDGCWIEPAETQRLLDDVLPGSGARIYAEVDGRPLVAHLARTASVATPEQAHAACLAAMNAYPTAMTPRHYVLHDRVPDDPDDPGAWTGVIGRGSGRPLREPAPGSADPFSPTLDKGVPR